jgi:DNA uptake protein ComE-like DNA-binding protein
MIHTNWKQYFYFSKKELKGIIVLGIILFGSVLIGQIFITKKPEDKADKVIVKTKLFYFDPNKIDSQTAILLGLPEKQVRSLMHYRLKGGRFKNRDDFAKLYGLSPENFQLLRPYILMNNESEKVGAYYYRNQPNRNAGLNKNERNEFDLKKININSINETEWSKITLIPQALVKQIIAYKTYLGVYTSVYQLKKVYGMNDSIFQLIRPNIYVLNKLNELPNANALNFNDWKKLNLFTDQQIWTILRLKKEHNGSISLISIVESCDLTEMEATRLKSKIQLSN